MNKEEFFSLRQKIIEKEYSNLNDMQKKAVFSTEGPLLVLAGAGSGKTTVLVNRIANIMKHGNAYYGTRFNDDITPYEEAMLIAAANGADVVPDIEHLLSENPAKPWQILAITFTNKAAGELKDRLISKIGPEAADIWASTFHSACVRILRRYADRIGFTSNFTIYDTDDSKKVIKDCMKALGLNDKLIQPKSVMSEISRAKDRQISPEEYSKENQYDYLKENTARIYELYQKKLKSSDAMDFDDIISYAVSLLKSDAEVREHYQNQFRYILVDEYQDTNNLQYVLISILAGQRGNICVVGDDDQSIYRFRGATIENILNFEDEFPNSKVIRLEQNYRSTQNILDAANAVIKNNENRKGKNLWTDKGEGEQIIVHRAVNDIEEGQYIAKTIAEGIRNGKRNSDFAVLYRMNSQSNLIEQALMKYNIPYKIVGGHKFYDRKEIKDALAYLSVIANPNDYVRLNRIINEPKRGIGEASFGYVLEISSALGLDIIEVMENAHEYPKLSRTANKLTDFAETLRKLISFSEVNKTSDLLKETLSITGYYDSLALEPERQEDREENLDQLYNNIVNFEDENEEATLTDYLQLVSLMTDIDSFNSEQDNVVLMTVHAAKGLEFNTVFLAGMEESIFPAQLSVDEGEVGIEEERRLAYVAITRAKEKLYISGCDARMLFGMSRFNPESRFVSEIPEDNKCESKETSQRNRQRVHFDEPGSRQVKKPFDNGFSGIKKKPVNTGISFRVGDTIIHKTWGEGVVLSVTNMGNDSLLEVAFLEGKTKKIMANFANIEKKNN